MNSLKPTEILSQEHRVIEQVLACLERIAAEAKAEGQLDGDSARDAIAFIRGFADKCHHGKEEDHLFPAMEARGFSRASGPTGVMLHEHEEGRRLVGAMDEVIATAEKGNVGAVQQFADNAQRFVYLLREHIQKEDHCLFSMANQALSDRDQEQLLEAFGHVESSKMGAGTHERFIAIANRLAERYGVSLAIQGAAACHGCGHH